MLLSVCGVSALLTMLLGVVPPEDSVADVAFKGDHHEIGAPTVSAWVAAGGRVAVTAECSACILDVELFRWRGVGARSSAPEATSRQISNDVIDTARLDVPEELAGHVAALDVRITVLGISEKAQELSRIIFVRVDADGDGIRLTPTTWAEYACTEGFARCEDNGRGGIELVYS